MHELNDRLKNTVGKTALGVQSPYPNRYDVSLLQPIKRAVQREAMGLDLKQKFFGADVWNAHEIFFLNNKGKPQRKILSFKVSADSPYLLESKSVKLYLNSLNNECFQNEFEALELINKDLSGVSNSKVESVFNDLSLMFWPKNVDKFFCLDILDILVTKYSYSPEILLLNKNKKLSENLVTHLFKSHCLCTGQPDFASIFISYDGISIEHESLLKYLLSFNNHFAFAENCIEQIFMDIMAIGKPEKLKVYGRFTCRGGIDINPWRETSE